MNPQLLFSWTCSSRWKWLCLDWTGSLRFGRVTDVKLRCGVVSLSFLPLRLLQSKCARKLRGMKTVLSTTRGVPPYPLLSRTLPETVVRWVSALKVDEYWMSDGTLFPSCAGRQRVCLESLVTVERRQQPVRREGLNSSCSFSKDVLAIWWRILFDKNSYP